MSCNILELPTRVLFIDPIDFSIPTSGNGNATVARSAMRNARDFLLFVGLTSQGDRLGLLHQKDVGGFRINVFFVGRTRPSRSVPLMPENLRFVISVLRYYPRLIKISSIYAISRTYTVVWLLTFILRRWKVLYYIPGLGNPMTIGRRPRVGRFLGRAFERVQSVALKKVDIACAAASREEIERYGERLRVPKGKVTALPTGVDTSLFFPADATVDDGAGRNSVAKQIILVAVGRLAAVKGVALLLDVVGILKRRGYQPSLNLIGDGEERKLITARIRNEGLERNITMLGNLSPAAVATRLRSADVFVMASHMEGFSNAMLEALATGLPIVTTSVSGASDIVAEGVNGYVVEGRSPEVFADRILDALKLSGVKEYSRDLCQAIYSDVILWKRIREKLGLSC